MYSKILTKLISEAITPFLGFLFIKILITIFTARSLGINSDLYSIFSLSVNTKDYITINSNVLLGFVIFSFLGLSYTLVKSIYFHNSHISPKISISILNFRVGFLIQDTFHLFSQSLIWLIYSYISLFLIVFLFLLGLSETYLVIVSSIFTLIGTYFFVLDIEYEMNRITEVEDNEEIFVS
jgi:hypothetical protein